MDGLTELMQRLLEINSCETQRSPELIAEDDRLMDGLQKKCSSTKSATSIEPTWDETIHPMPTEFI
jgi:hypothetical protein